MKVILESLKAIVKNPLPVFDDIDTVSGTIEGIGTVKVARSFGMNEVSGLPCVNIRVTLNDTKVYSYTNHDFSLDDQFLFNSGFQSAKKSQDATLNEKKKIDMSNFSEWCNNKIGN